MVSRRTSIAKSFIGGREVGCSCRIVCGVSFHWNGCLVFSYVVVYLRWRWNCIVGLVVMMFLYELHYCMCKMRCGIDMLGWTYLWYLNCDVFRVFKSFVSIACCLVTCASVVMNSRLWSWRLLRFDVCSIGL